MDDALLARYRHSLAKFCYYTAKVQRYADDSDIRSAPEKEMAETLAYLSFWKDALLSDKKEAGFDDGLSFLEDNRFLSFEIKDGKFIGDKEGVYPVIDKWLSGFPKSVNNYQFEVAMYVMNLAYEASPDVMASSPACKKEL